MNKNKAGVCIAVLAGMIVVLGCSKLTQMANEAATNAKQPKTSDSKTFTLEGKEWKSYDLANTDIHVDLPGTPKDDTPPLPPNVKGVFSAMHIHSLAEKDFNSSYTQLVPAGKRTFEIKFLADTSMTALKKQLPDLTYTLDQKSPTNTKINGAFTRAGKGYDLRGCVVYKKEAPASVWCVLTMYLKDNADGQTASQRIIDSVVFKDSTEACK